VSLKAKSLKTYIAYLRPRLANHHISRPFFYTTSTLFFHASGENSRFVLSLDDENPRFYLAKDDIEATTLESKFLDGLKKEIANAYVVDVEELNDDRIVKFSLTVINSVYKEEGRSLYFEMIPHHANLILTDLSDHILFAYRPGEMSDERPMLKGLVYLPPEKKPFVDVEEAFDPKDYEANCLANEQLLFDKRKKDRFGYLFEALKKRQKLLEKKLVALEGDRQEAESHMNDGQKGDAIYMKYNEINNRQGSFIYEGETIALDPSRSLSANAQLYYRRAKKAKETLKLYEANKTRTQKSLQDVLSALKQLSLSDEAGLEALAKELEISPQNPTQKKKNGDWKGLSHDSIPWQIDYHGTKILFGKSAKQNDCLTFLLSTAKEHLWFHVMGTTGSHVMIKKDHPSDDEIKAACEVCLINSSLDDGDVIMAERKAVRKGSVMGQAIVKESKTIHLKMIRPEIRNLLASAERMPL
jgi:predicted ribosome quality control (RQC) complex YloA/Tae2 family protein